MQTTVPASLSGKQMARLASAPIVAVLCAVLAGSAAAQSVAYPVRPVRVIVAFPAGGSVDTVGRLTSQRFADAFGQPFIVDNRAGASGLIGTEAVARAAPDGYTLLMGSASSISAAPSIFAKMPYDPIRDLAPVVLVANQPNVLIVHPSVPVRTVKEFIALARANPGKLNYGSSGIGASQHMASELFAMMTGVKIVHVPYKGGAPAMADLLGGQIDFMFDTAPTTVPMLRANKVRALAVTSAERSRVFPELPTMDEAGLKGYEMRGWIGLMAPPAIARDVVNRLNAEVTKMLAGDLRAKLFDLGLDVAGGTPESFGAFIKADMARYQSIVKGAGIPLQ